MQQKPGTLNLSSSLRLAKFASSSEICEQDRGGLCTTVPHKYEI